MKLGLDNLKQADAFASTVQSRDLKLQQLVDRELTKDVTTKLTSAKDGQVLNVELTFKPVNFQEALNELLGGGRKLF